MADVITTILNDAADALREKIKFDDERIESLTSDLARAVEHRRKTRASLVAVQQELLDRQKLVFSVSHFEFRDPSLGKAAEPPPARADD